MARAATTSDAINAIAEPRRRQSLVLLRGGEQTLRNLATYVTGVARQRSAGGGPATTARL